MTTHSDRSPASADSHKAALDKRLEDIGWGLFLIMIGSLWLVPEERVPEGAWLVGTGLLLLGLNAVRYFNGIRMSGLTTLLGVLALAAGLGDLLGVKLPLLAICLIVLGAGIILRPLLARRG